MPAEITVPGVGEVYAYHLTGTYEPHTAGAAETFEAYDVGVRQGQALIEVTGSVIGTPPTDVLPEFTRVSKTAASMAAAARPAAPYTPPPLAGRWTDTAGQEVPADQVESSAGPRHCDWQSVTFLQVGGPPLKGGREFLRDPQHLLADEVDGTYAPDVELPADARDTGWRRDGAALWLTGNAAYVITGDHVERWPQATQGIGCA